MGQNRSNDRTGNLCKVPLRRGKVGDMLKVDCVQVCQGPEVIAFLQEGPDGVPSWHVPLYEATGTERVIDAAEAAQLNAVVSGETTGYMGFFRGVEYTDVVVVVVR